MLHIGPRSLRQGRVTVDVGLTLGRRSGFQSTGVAMWRLSVSGVWLPDRTERRQTENAGCARPDSPCGAAIIERRTWADIECLAWCRGRRDYGRSYRVAHLPEPGGRYFAMTRSSARATTSWLGSAAGADRSWSRALIGDPHDAGMTTSHVPHPFNFPFPSRRRQRLLRLFAAGEALSAAAAGRTPLPLWGPNIQPCRLTRRKREFRRLRVSSTRIVLGEG